MHGMVDLPVDEPPVGPTVPSPLPRGRHNLSRGEVRESQRRRIVTGLADAMLEQGYVGTPVAAVLTRSGVSRETFYQLYDSKLACFLDAFDVASEVLVARIGAAVDPRPTDDPSSPFERALVAYLDALASEPGYARLFLVEVHAAGPEAMARRAAVQDLMADAVADLLGAGSEPARFTCRLLVSAIASMVTQPLVTGDLEALRGLAVPILDHVARLREAGLLE